MNVQYPHRPANATSAFFDVERVIAAATSSKTMAEAIRKLGYVAHSDNFRRFREACNRYRVPVPTRQSSTNEIERRKLFERETFANRARIEVAASGAESQYAVLNRLGLQTTKANYARLADAAERHGIELPQRRSAHGSERGILRARLDALAEAMTAAEWSAMLSEVKTRPEVLAALGLPDHQRTRTWIRERAVELGLELPTKNTGGFELPDAEYFVDGVRRSSSSVRKRLLRDELVKNECALCGQAPVWNGAPLTLQLDHIDGHHQNNRLDNLRLLCPNCHAQTDTYCKPHERRRSMDLAA